jgi:hypothetical protein
VLGEWERRRWKTMDIDIFEGVGERKTTWKPGVVVEEEEDEMDEMDEDEGGYEVEELEEQGGDGDVEEPAGQGVQDDVDMDRDHFDVDEEEFLDPGGCVFSPQ